MSASSPLRRLAERAGPEGALVASGLAAITLTLALCRHVPFQDIPNHIAILSLDPVLRAGGGSELLQPAPGVTLGYSLLVELARAGGPLLGVEGVVRVLCIAAAVALPLGAMWLARVAGSAPGWAGVLALPVALSWPLRVGMLPYALGMPFVVFGLAAAIAAARTRGTRPLLVLAGLSIGGYLAHPYAYVWLALLGGGAGAWLARASIRDVSRVVCGLGAAAPLFVYDLVRHRLDMVDGADATLLRSPTWWRPWHLAIFQILTRGLGIPGGRALLLYAPLVAVLVTASVLALREAPAPARASRRAVLLGAAVAATAGTALLPDSRDNVFLLASRVTALGVLFWAALAAPALARVRWLRAAAMPAVILALGGQLQEIRTRSQLVSDVVGASGPEKVTGAYLPVQIPRCSDASTVAWGGYDPLRHAWAYALGPAAVAPYLFAGSRYQPVWFRAGVLRDRLYGPNEHLLTDNEQRPERMTCAEVAQDRLSGAAAWRGAYDGILVIGRQPEVGRELARSGLAVERQLAPGMYVVRRPPLDVAASAQIPFATMIGGSAIDSGFYSPEIIDGRPAQWSQGRKSSLTLSLAGGAPSYVLSVHAKAIEAQSVEVVVNDRWHGTMPIGTHWGRWLAVVPGDVVWHGLNGVKLYYSRIVRPSARGDGDDERELAVAYDALALEPVPAAVDDDLGTPRVRAMLRSGFSREEAFEGHTAVWSSGASSEIVFAVQGDPVAHSLYLLGKGHVDPAAREGAQRVTLTWNGANETQLLFPPSWTEVAVTVPAGVVRPGQNELRLVYASPSSAGPADRRMLGVAFDRLSIEPVPAQVQIDLGTARGRAWLRGEWGSGQEIAGRTAVWSKGPVAELEVPFEPALASDTGTVELGFAALADAPEDVEVSVEGRVVGVAALAAAWRPFTFTVPLPLLRSGPNAVKWSVRAPTAPAAGVARDAGVAPAPSAGRIAVAEISIR